MKKTFCLFIILTSMVASKAQNTWQYYFDKPADIWEESIPLGNGRIGMMPYGGIEKDRIVLNEISLWSGNKQDADNPDAYKHLEEIRHLLFTNKNKEAQDLVYKTFTCLGKGSSDYGAYGNFQNFGNLYTDFIYPDSDAEVTNYRRTLDMNNALSVTTFKKGGITYTREYFTSFSDDIGVVRYTASKPKSLSFKLSMQRDELFNVSAKDNLLDIEGQLKDNVKNDGMRYFGRVKVLNKDGSIKTLKNSIEVSDATEVTLLISMATSYRNGDQKKKASSYLAASSQDFTELREKHIPLYQRLFNRVDITLNKNKNSSLPIDKRLEAFKQDRSDNDLAALYMQYGRYLLISSTREGGLPPNLQGLWASQISTPWNGDYHLNINLQMNFWGAEVGNLSELHRPLIDYIKSLTEPGSKTARIYYNSRGWVTHILGNVWGFTSPSEDPSWGATNTGGAWLCQHLWEHYAYTCDTTYLRSVYPIMKGSALFFSDMLIENPENGYLVTAPTTSPENSYLTDNGDIVSICAGSTMDNQIIRELFTNVINAANILNTDKQWADELAAKRARLAPTSIGKYGQVMEWLKDYEEYELHHRHVSPLYGLYPGYEMTYDKTPELMQAAKTTLKRRGDESTGWSMAWKISFWARLKDGDRAFKLIGDLLKPAGTGRGTYPNLFSAHPPMQIDGNFGGSSGIMEMLVQSHAGYIEFLPALPHEWNEGEVKGFRVRGGAEVSFAWKNSTLTNLSIQASSTNTFKIKKPERMKVKMENFFNYKEDDEFISINLAKGECCTIKLSY